MTPDKLKRLEDIEKRNNECCCSNVIYDDELKWLLRELRASWAQLVKNKVTKISEFEAREDAELARSLSVATLRSNAKLQDELTEKDLHINRLKEVLKHSDAAMTYAYEDHCDQYYLNVQEKIRKAMLACTHDNIGTTVCRHGVPTSKKCEICDLGKYPDKSPDGEGG